MRRIIVYLDGSRANPSKLLAHDDGGQLHKPFTVGKT